jgi:hypothetical protein
MCLGDLKLWRSQIVCWGLFVLFAVLAAIWFYFGREPTKSYTGAQRHTLLIAGAVSACIAVLFLFFAWRAKMQRRHNDVG